MTDEELDTIFPLVGKINREINLLAPLLVDHLLKKNIQCNEYDVLENLNYINIKKIDSSLIFQPPSVLNKLILFSLAI